MEDLRENESDASQTDTASILKQDEEFGGFFCRMGAYIIDVAIATISGSVTLGVLFGLFFPDSSFWDTLSPSVDTLLSVFFMITFTAISLALWSTTPGKILYGLRVVDADTGKSIDTGQAVVRSVSYLLSSVFFGMGFWSVMLNKRRQAWHDKIAETIVIRHRGKNLWWGLIVSVLLIGLLVFVR